MRIRPPAQALAAGALVVVSACSDRTEPTAPDSPPTSTSLQPAHQGTGDDPVALARQVPGFGGFFLDDQGIPVIYLKSSAQRGNAERALAPYLRAEGFSPAQLRVLPARNEWVQLESWLPRVSSAALAAQGAVFVDADEANNTVTIGLERGALSRIRGIVAGLGIPMSAIAFKEAEPIRRVATLRNRVRPVVGGLQINFPGFLCSLGFNALRNSQRSFITASHCTNVQGGVEATPYYQALQSVTPTKIATEVSDPMYLTGGGCPAGKRCRFSDAARASYTAGTTSTLGRIAKTTGPNNNSITISGALSITAEGTAAVGQTVGKIGRTTGWTTGKVTNTCVNVLVGGTNLGLFCQNLVSAKVAGGDSGSPVFKGSSNVTLVGILWGSNSAGTQYVYSPMSGIERELGALTTF